MMTEHTPGPWQVCDGRHLGICVRVEGPPLEWVEDNPPVPICEMFDLNWQANARLIAAAPDLLEALDCIAATFWAYLYDRGAVVGDDGHPAGGYWESLREARAAIAKATT